MSYYCITLCNIVLYLSVPYISHYTIFKIFKIETNVLPSYSTPKFLALGIQLTATIQHPASTNEANPG